MVDPPGMIKVIASLGGYLNRKNDLEPEPACMWWGMRNLFEHVKARESLEQAFGVTYG